jgi:hypothetical protein
VHQYGLVGARACATAHVPDKTLQGLMRLCDERMMVLRDTAFHAAAGAPANLQRCRRGECQERGLVETVLSRLKRVCHFKKVMPRVWEDFHARLAFTLRIFNALFRG